MHLRQARRPTKAHRSQPCTKETSSCKTNPSQESTGQKVNRFKAIAKLVGWFLWFTAALLLVTASAGLAMGAATGNALTGVIVMFGGAMLLVFGEIGRTMITRMSVLVSDLQRAFKKASDHIDEQAEQKNK